MENAICKAFTCKEIESLYRAASKLPRNNFHDDLVDRLLAALVEKTKMQLQADKRERDRLNAGGTYAD